MVFFVPSKARKVSAVRVPGAGVRGYAGAV